MLSCLILTPMYRLTDTFGVVFEGMRHRERRSSCRQGTRRKMYKQQTVNVGPRATGNQTLKNTSERMASVCFQLKQHEHMQE